MNSLTSFPDLPTSDQPPYELGDKVIDTVTGFTGRVLAITTYLYSSDRVGVAPAQTDATGKPQDLVWIDAAQLERAPSTTA